MSQFWALPPHKSHCKYREKWGGLPEPAGCGAGHVVALQVHAHPTRPGAKQPSKNMMSQKRVSRQLKSHSSISLLTSPSRIGTESDCVPSSSKDTQQRE